MTAVRLPKSRDLVSGALSGLSYGRMLGTIVSVFIWGLGIIAALNQIGSWRLGS